MDPDGYPPPFQDVPHVLGVAPTWLTPLGVTLPLLLMALLVASVVAMVVRYRRAGGAVSRAQLRWFALGATLLPLTLLLCWLSYLVLGTADLVIIGLGLTAVAIPAATTIALLRHDLYDVDRAFSSTVTYGLVSALLLAVFTAAEAVGGVLFGRGSAVAAAAATALCALALSPLRARLTAQVDRRLYPLRESVRVGLVQLREGSTRVTHARRTCGRHCGPRCATRACASATCYRAVRGSSTSAARRSTATGRFPCCSGAPTSDRCCRGPTPRAGSCFARPRLAPH